MSIFVSFILASIIFIILAFSYMGAVMFVNWMKYKFKNPSNTISDWLREVADKYE